MIKLKGGSLGSTHLFEPPGGKKFIRKSVSLNKNREYGYMRWSSQLKKIQRMNTILPDLFPKILGVGNSEERAWFDMPFYEYPDVKNWFSMRIPDFGPKEIEVFNKKLWQAFDRLHWHTLSKVDSTVSLYYEEEVVKKLEDAMENAEFRTFTKYQYYRHLDKKIPNLDKFTDVIRRYFYTMEVEHEEFIHGNPTLENILYDRNTESIMFIDPYEESIIDSKLLDYSQVLQCSRSLYGHYNGRSFNSYTNSVWPIYDVFYEYENTPPVYFSMFNEMFEGELLNRCSREDYKFVDVLEATQFIRMLPFKVQAGDIEAAKFFYVHACKLLENIFG